MVHFWPSLTIAKKIQFQYLFLKFDAWKKIKFQNLDLDCKLSARPRDCEGKKEEDEDLQQEVE